MERIGQLFKTVDNFPGHPGALGRQINNLENSLLEAAKAQDWAKVRQLEEYWERFIDEVEKAIKEAKKAGKLKGCLIRHEKEMEELDKVRNTLRQRSGRYLPAVIPGLDPLLNLDDLLSPTPEFVPGRDVLIPDPINNGWRIYRPPLVQA
jgi:hypothetical protein